MYLLTIINANLDTDKCPASPCITEMLYSIEPYACVSQIRASVSSCVINLSPPKNYSI